MYYTEKEKGWTAKDYVKFWRQQVGKTFEFRNRAYGIKHDEIFKSATITHVRYLGHDRVDVYYTATFESGKQMELVACENYKPTSEGTFYNQVIHQMYCYTNFPYYFYIPLKQALKKDGSLKRRTIFKPWGMHCTIY